ncbi:MAG: hypothetical protein HYR85_09285 [Planctomycetes bacterium]|nr:hypothetical protein [Planctomycetota bacterium]MBI3848323.1 hypothetical protein [Planctomycetota bacterium]
MKTIPVVLGVLLGAGLASAAFLVEKSAREDATQAMLAKINELQKQIAELDASNRTLSPAEIDKRIQDAIERTTPAERPVVPTVSDEATKSPKVKKSAVVAKESEDDAADDGRDVDPYGISVPPEAERQIRAIYGRLKAEERQRQRERDEQRRDDQVKDRVDRLAEELNLNAQQKPAVERVLLDEAKKRSELFQQDDNDPNGGRGRGRRDFSKIGDQMRQISQERDAALQTVLDFDQMKKFRESDQRRGRFGFGGPGGGQSDGG